MFSGSVVLSRCIPQAQLLASYPATLICWGHRPPPNLRILSLSLSRHPAFLPTLSCPASGWFTQTKIDFADRTHGPLPDKVYLDDPGLNDWPKYPSAH